MDLGATVCATRSPHCLLCPVRERLCRARAPATQERYPVKSRRLVRGRRENVWLELRWRDAVWLVERGAERRLGRALEPARDRLDRRVRGDDGGLARTGRACSIRSSTCSRISTGTCSRCAGRSRRATPAPALAPLLAAWPGGRWLTNDAALALGLPAPLRKRLQVEATAGA